MPVFDLRCRKCGRVYEDWGLAGNEEVIQKCVCGSVELHKIAPKCAIRFRGQGFQTPSPKPSDGN